MARKRSATDLVYTLSEAAIIRALEASLAAGSIKDFYPKVAMRNPSRSYFLTYQKRLHSLKAVVAYALREELPGALAKDFHASDGAGHLRSLRSNKFKVVHGPDPRETERTMEWARRLSRKGQAAFRASVGDVFGQCAFSECTTVPALEAAHVLPVSSKGADHPQNGILLRIDLHRLFDAHLIAINPSDGKIHVADNCLPDYASLSGKKAHLPPSGPKLSSFGTRWKKFND